MFFHLTAAAADQIENKFSFSFFLFYKQNEMAKSKAVAVGRAAAVAGRSGAHLGPVFLFAHTATARTEMNRRRIASSAASAVARSLSRSVSFQLQK